MRECAEAQSKDFGLIATDKGWNGAYKSQIRWGRGELMRFAVFLGGNGGANPKHAVLFAQDVPPSNVVRIIDRFVRSLLLPPLA